MNGKMYFQTFTVSGKLSFPVDMLRYDHCWPVDDASGIENSIRRDPRPGPDGVYRVKLGRWVTSQHTQPTVERWRSFLWSVDRDSVKTQIHE